MDQADRIWGELERGKHLNGLNKAGKFISHLHFDRALPIIAAELNSKAKELLRMVLKCEYAANKENHCPQCEGKIEAFLDGKPEPPKEE